MDTNFQNGTIITADWLNDVNDFVYGQKFRTVLATDYGVVADGVTDSTVPLRNAIAACLVSISTLGVRLVLPPGVIRVTDEIQIQTTGGKRWEIGPVGSFEITEFLVDFTGADKAVLIFGNKTTLTYQTGVSLHGLTFRKAGTGQAPIGILANGLAQSRLQDITFGSWDNTTIQMWAPQNCRMTNITCFGGGRAWSFKDTTGITARQTGNSLVASGAIFDSSCVGKTIALWGPAPNLSRRKAVITGYTDSTHVTVDGGPYTDTVDYAVHFGSAGVSMTAGSAEVSSDSAVFSSTDVGLTVLVPGAGNSGRPLRAKIVSFTSATSITLATQAATSVTNTEIAVPSIALHSDGTVAGQGGSDNSFSNLQIESFSGVGISLSDQDQLSFSATKIHGEQTPVGNARSLSAMWADQVSGYYQGSFDAQLLGNYRLRMAYQSSVFTFNSLITRNAVGEKFLQIGLRASGYEGGLVHLANITFSNYTTGYELPALITDSNATIPGYVVSGKVSYSNADQTYVVLSSTVKADTRGNVIDEQSIPIRRTSDGGALNKDIPTTFTWAGTTAPSGTVVKTYSWQRIGRRVDYQMRIKYAVAGSTISSVVIPLPSDMPAATYDSAVSASENICFAHGAMSVDETSAPALCKAMLRLNAAGTGTELWIATNSGTVNTMVVYASGSYFTA